MLATFSTTHCCHTVPVQHRDGCDQGLHLAKKTRSAIPNNHCCWVRRRPCPLNTTYLAQQDCCTCKVKVVISYHIISYIRAYVIFTPVFLLGGRLTRGVYDMSIHTRISSVLIHTADSSSIPTIITDKRRLYIPWHFLCFDTTYVLTPVAYPLQYSSAITTQTHFDDCLEEWSSVYIYAARCQYGRFDRDALHTAIQITHTAIIRQAAPVTQTPPASQNCPTLKYMIKHVILLLLYAL